MEQTTKKALIVDLGTIAYQEAWDLQHRIHEAKQAGMPADILLLLEHPHVFTLAACRTCRPRPIRHEARLSE